MSVAVAAAALNKRVTIQIKARTSDSAGGGSIEWLDFATVWANVKPITGIMRMRMRAEQLTDETTHTVTIRHLTGVRTGMRFSYGYQPDSLAPRLLMINYVIDDGESGVLLKCDCREIRES